MGKWRVYAIATASKLAGVVEAETREEAIKKAEESNEMDTHFSLCWQCANELEVSDVSSFQVEEEDGS